MVDLCQPADPGRDEAVYRVLMWINGICLDDQPIDVQYAISNMTTVELRDLVEKSYTSHVAKFFTQLRREWTDIIVVEKIRRGIPLPPTPTRRRKAQRPQGRKQVGPRKVAA